MRYLPRIWDIKQDYGFKNIDTWGLFHKTLWIRKLRICSYGQILTVNLLINCKNSVIYGKIAVNYEEKCFMEQAPDNTEEKKDFYLLGMFLR